VNVIDVVRTLATRVETVRVVRTAINPLLWLDFVVGALALGAAIWVGDPLVRAGFFFLLALTIFVTLVAYFVLLFRDPDRLQSEEYRLRQRALRLVHRRGLSAEALDATRDIVRLEKLNGRRTNGDEP
jgi:hypothetical protein